MQSGKYETHIGGQVILSEEGKLYMASNPKLLAGSAQLLPAGIGFLVSNDIVTLADAWDMASLRPANLLGFHNLGRIEIGAKADLVAFTAEQGSIRIVDTFKDGCRIGN